MGFALDADRLRRNIGFVLPRYGRDPHWRFKVSNAMVRQNRTRDHGRTHAF